MLINIFIKYLYEIIFYISYGCEIIIGVFLSEVSSIIIKYRRKKRWNVSWYIDI